MTQTDPESHAATAEPGDTAPADATSTADDAAPAPVLNRAERRARAHGKATAAASNRPGGLRAGGGTHANGRGFSVPSYHPKSGNK
jgi:hypothetical protein